MVKLTLETKPLSALAVEALVTILYVCGSSSGFISNLFLCSPASPVLHDVVVTLVTAVYPDGYAVSIPPPTGTFLLP